MAEHSTIEWTEATWNPIIGCSVVSSGCTNCYAMRDAYRKGFNPRVPQYHGLTKLVNGNPVWTGEVRLSSQRSIYLPLTLKRPRLIFVNSMGDLFHEKVPDAWIDLVFAIMVVAPQHTYQVLTKRASRMRQYMRDVTLERIAKAALASVDCWPLLQPQWPLPQVSLGVSTERQQEADERIPELLATPAAVRFISVEPMIAPIRLEQYLIGNPRLDWVIVGGESGPDVRPMDEAWARSIRDECAAAGVAFFMKQMTGKGPIPADLLIRQSPGRDAVRV
jgi:protein gp37